MAIAEICCGSYEDALVAEAAGAKRIELNCSLEMGGLTPTIATVNLVKQHTSLEVVAMSRPRGSGFLYSPQEQMVIYQDASFLLEHGVDGIAFGFLTSERLVDEVATKKMVKLIHHYGKTAVFHRAFDQVSAPAKAIEQLIACGVDRVLTSGTYSVAPEGVEVLKMLQTMYGDQIELLAGGGVTHDNCLALMEQTGLSQVHSSCKVFVYDESRNANATSAKESFYIKVDLALAKLFVETVEKSQFGGLA